MAALLFLLDLFADVPGLFFFHISSAFTEKKHDIRNLATIGVDTTENEPFKV